MRFDLSKLRGLTPGQQAGVLENAIKAGTLSSPDALRIAKQQGLGADEIAGLSNIQFSGRGYGQAGNESTSRLGPISKTHAIFRGLLGWAPFDKPVPPTKTVGGVQVPAEVADRINARVAYSSTPNPTDPVLSEELKHTNCYGALLSAMFGPDERRSSVLLLPREKALLPYKVYASSAQLSDALREVPAPVALLLGPHASHVALFLGFDEAGQGMVFHKQNLGPNFPWMLLSLESLFAQYCVPDEYGHEQGVRVAKPKL